MWVEELANGKYKFCERYYDEKLGKTKKVSVTLTAKSPQAEKKATQMLLKKIEKLKNEPRPNTRKLGETIEEWKKYYKPTVRSSTYIRMCANFKVMEEVLNMNYLLDKVDDLTIHDALHKIHYELNYSKSTIKQMLSGLNMFYKYCLKKKYIKQNPIPLIDFRFKPEKVVPMSDKYVTREEIEKILGYFYKVNKRYGQMTELFILNGFRYSELTNLKYSDVEDGKVKINDSKTATGVREVSLDQRSQEIFKQIKFENSILFPDTDRFFITSNGNPILNDNYSRSLKTACKKNGIVKNVTAHSLRHTHITILAEMGVDIRTIMHRVGHAKPDVTLKTYTHVTQEMDHSAVDKLNNSAPFLPLFDEKQK